MTTVKKGISGDIVKVAQILIEYSDTSGTFGETFEAFVKSWQLKHSLSADGIIGAATWMEIAKNAPTVSIKSLRKGKYAQAVQLLVGVDPDGIFGIRTGAAVAAFQSSAGLTADGIVGKNTWAALLGVTSQSTGKVINACVHYTQYDKRWGSIMYSSHNDKKQTIATSGCGPTSMAQIAATFIDPTITPKEMAELALKGGYRTYSSGTAWGFFEYAYNHIEGFSKFVKTGNLATLIAALREGALAVCSMNSGDNNFWTKGGHFITAIGVDDTYIYANDPNKSSAPRKQAHAKFKTCMKQAFIFYK